MELTKDINLSLDSFEKDKDFTINYSGALYKSNSNDVYLNFGYGDTWENKEELKMSKSQNGYSVNVTPKNSGVFNFCFRNNNNEWDNNSYQNYSIDVKEQTKTFSIETPNIDVQEPEAIEEFSIEEEIAAPVSEKAGIQNTIESNEGVENCGSVEAATERKTFNIDAIIEEILNTDIEPTPIPVQPIQPEPPKIEKIIAKDNPTHINKTSLLVEDVLVPFYSNETTDDKNNQFLPVDPKTYSKFFTIKNKIKLAIYKIINAIPKLITGNYTKKKHSES